MVRRGENGFCSVFVNFECSLGSVATRMLRVLPAKNTATPSILFFVIPVLGMICEDSGSEVGETVTVATQERIQFEGIKVAGDEALRLGERAEEPAEIKFVSPNGNVDLVAGEKGDRGTDAVNSGAIAEG